MLIPDWRLPRGVSRSLWEYAHDPCISLGDSDHLAGSPLMELDERLVVQWFTSPGALVDLGCGPGRLLVASARRGFDCLGVDLSPGALHLAAESAAREGVKIGLVRANLCELNCLIAGRFDYALLMFGTLGMIEGAANRAAALAHARRILKPGGLLALHVHNVWRHLFDPDGRRWLLRDRLNLLIGRPAGDTRRDYRGIPNMFHHAFSRGELMRILKSSGFAVREVVPVQAVSTGIENRARPRLSFSNLTAAGWIVLASRL